MEGLKKKGGETVEFLFGPEVMELLLEVSFSILLLSLL